MYEEPAALRCRQEDKGKLIDKDNFHVFNYIKKEEYTGSMDGMRYMLRKKEGEETRLEAVIWPEPFGYRATPEKKKQRMEFEFSARGLEEAVDWMNEQYEGQSSLWGVIK